MSFEQIKAEIEAVVIQPLLAFHGKTSPLNQIHNDNTRDFSNIIAGLLTGSDGETAFQGDGSMALADLIGSYLNVEQSITGSGTDFVGHLLEAAQDSERTAHQLQQELNSIAAQQDHTVQSAAGIAIGLDTGAVAQGGIDIPWDIVAAGATLVAAGLAAAYNADQEKSQQAQMAKYTAIAEWSREMGGIASEPLAQLPPSPTNANGDASSFLKLIGLGVLVAASTTTTSTSTGVNLGKLFSTMKTTPDGRRIRVRKLSPKEVSKLQAEWGQSFHRAKKGYKATDEIYEDENGEYWIGRPGSENVVEFP